MKTIGERIRQAREKRRMSGEELARLAGYKNQSAIGNIENRNTGTGGRKISELARILRVPLEWLIDGPDSVDVPDAPPHENHDLSHETKTPTFAREPAALNFDLAVEAMKLFTALTVDGQRQAILYLKFLNSNTINNPHQEPGEDTGLPDSKAA